MTIKEKIKIEEEHYNYMLKRSTEEKFQSGRGKIVAQRMIENSKKRIAALKKMDEEEG